jgi:hypothetical protein
MDNLIDFGILWSDYGVIVLTSVFWVIVFLILGKAILRKNVHLQDEVEDLAASNRWNMEAIAEADQAKKVADTAWLAAANENLKLRRENHLLKEKISKKREFRLRNGCWCTEEQYIEELCRFEKRLDNVHEEQVEELQEKLDAVDINEECNKQIESFLANSDRVYSQEEKDEVIDGMLKELDNK